MFHKRVKNDTTDAAMKDSLQINGDLSSGETGNHQKIASKNTILKGNKLIGDITVSCDLELSGEIEGSITSEKDSNILIKGICRGDIKTREGSVQIEGELRGGNITAGKDITISGTYEGGEIKAAGRITINGEFNGKLEANEIEIGPDAHGTGELFYRESISISRGAVVEGQICKLPAELHLIKNAPETKTDDVRPSVKEAGGA